jgi:AraC-like DNA-binding protein
MSGLSSVSSDYNRSFVDPERYHASIRGGDSLYSVLARGTFHAELTDITVGTLKLQRGRETLPRLAASGMPADKVGILAWFGDGRLPVVRGVQISPGEVLSLAPGMQSHHRTSGPNEFVALTLDASELNRAANELTGRDLTPGAGIVLRPPGQLLARLLSVIDAATRVSKTTPEVFSSPQASRALEQALLQPMIECLLDREARQEASPRRRRAALAKRFEAAVEANLDQPLSIPDFCRTLGIPERSLRNLCQEQLGMSPVRFLALRRLHLARLALLRADHHATTVTQIAMDHGVWELGRFAVTYKALFGESPSATLHRRPTA